MFKIVFFTLLAFVLSFVLAPLFIHFLYKFQAREEINPDLPEGHQKKRGTPTMAGLLIVFAVALINLLFNLSRSETYLPIFALITAGALGTVDDVLKIQSKRKSAALKETSNVPASFGVWGRLRPIFWPWRIFKALLDAVGGSASQVGFKSYHKYLFQLLIGSFFAFWFYFKLSWSTYWLPLVGPFDLGLFYIPLSIFLFTLFLNSLAITDGLDGLAGGLAALLFGSLGVVAFFQNQLGLAIFCATMVGSLLAFLYFNFFPARVFMGNVGSHALGSAAIVVAFLLRKELLVFLMGGAFLLEVVSDVVQVISKRSGRGKVFLMAPLHHHFELLGWPETKVTLRFWLLGAVFSLLGLLFSFI